MLKLPNPSPPTKKMKNKKKINIQILQNRGASGPQKKKKTICRYRSLPPRRAPPRMLDRALKATAPNKLFPPAHPCPTHTQHRQYPQ